MHPHSLPAVLLVTLLTAGCATTAASISPERVEAEEARLMAPYLESRGVVADDLLIEISANFYSEVARPAVSRTIHELVRETSDGDDVYRWTSRGGLQSPLNFQVGAMQLAALQSATLRVRGRGELALAVTASGHVTESVPGQGLADWQELRVADGRITRE